MSVTPSHPSYYVYLNHIEGGVTPNVEGPIKYIEIDPSKLSRDQQHCLVVDLQLNSLAARAEVAECCCVPDICIQGISTRDNL